ncbi:MAG: isoprenylcysteine carboxylmethyltransferase family protein [Rhodoferax sp.]|nr:isoprenylcysteine carboxylmethyltransferase family protein [Rhodoferax sp.]MCF8210704.1 isoprenylcysteine carboxylmethyltransferase family protein [Rhodoferax sp.]
MKVLELKVPPLLVVLLVGAAMWVVSHYALRLDVPEPFRILGALTLAFAGGGIALSGTRAFRQAKTTVNPLAPEKSSALVRTGIYGMTRNPMYLGMLLVLAGWSVFLASGPAFLGLPGFVLYMGRFQIAPEECILERLFGTDYLDYKRKVRRWL